MKGSRVLIVLFLLATVSADLAALSIVGSEVWFSSFRPTMAFVVLLALLHSQIGLIAVWGSWSRDWIPLRLGGVFLFVAVWSVSAWLLLPDSQAASPAGATQRGILLAVPLLTVFMPLLIVRLQGVALRKGDDAQQSGDDVSRRFQFTIGYLLVWMTAVAVVLGTCQYLVRFRFPFVPMEITRHVDLAIALGMGHGVIALLSVWAVLGAKGRTVRTARQLLYLAATACVVYSLHRVSVRREPLHPSAVLYAVEALLLIASLGVFRLCGYRLTYDDAPAVDDGAEDDKAATDA